jgi:hypothetical protein
VIPRPERDADEGTVSLECHVGDGGERSIPAGDAQGIGRRAASNLLRAFSRLEHVRPDPTSPRFAG